jgi:hypothetical protein
VLAIEVAGVSGAVSWVGAVLDVVDDARYDCWFCPWLGVDTACAEGSLSISLGRSLADVMIDSVSLAFDCRRTMRGACGWGGGFRLGVRVCRTFILEFLPTA